MPELENPFQETLIQRHRAEACTVVIFGATGDLTHRKLIPALYNLATGGDLPAQFKVVGFARREKTDEGFRAELEESNKKNSRQGHDAKLWAGFARNIHYHCSEFQDLEGYKSLKTMLDNFDRERGAPANRLFYLASAPEFFDQIMLLLRQSGLNEGAGGKWARVVCEKPFGRDLATARHLNEVVNATFHESDTYRIDHYLGKETAQNIMVLRFANLMFEPNWNSRYIDHVQITCAENLGMEGGRGGYYDTAGALRDMVQNHLFQLLSLVAMEPPTDLSADSVRDEKVKVIRALQRYEGAEEVRKNVVRAQYTAGSVDGAERVGYRQEDRVHPQSMTESYVALRLFVNTWRWQGVPFYMRMGKQLPKKATEISVHFKYPPQAPFPTTLQRGTRNVLVIRIQPDEGISLRMLSKMPGVQLLLQPVKMDFRYSTSFGKASPEAYERLLLDAMTGDATLFARRDEVETAWSFIDEIEHAWHNDGPQPPMCEYPAGSWGPKEADDLLDADGRVWRRLEFNRTGTMSATLEDSLAVLGQEVPLDRVDKALKELWGKDEARTRASLMNFAIYSEDPASIEANTRLLEEITHEHACRGMLLLAPTGGTPGARAWVTAHCQLHDGHKSVCSEQVSFLLEGGSMNQVRNVVFAHLDSDLPLVCWWQGDLTRNFSERFYSVMDMLFIDSSGWRSPVRDFAALETALSQTTARFRVYDLSWLRSHLFRTALASCFCDESPLAELASLRSVEITHSKGHRVAGLLIAAWIGVRLKCRLEPAAGIKLVNPEGSAISVSLREGGEGEALQRIELRSARASLSVSRDCGEAFVCTRVQVGDHHHEQMLPADPVTDAAVIGEQLSRLGGQSLYLQMLPMLRGLLVAK